MKPLASADKTQLQSNTNLSTSLSLTILDQNGNEIPLSTTFDQQIELIIPRDPNLVIPSMSLQNVTSMNLIAHHQLFNLHFVQISLTNWNYNRTLALMIEIHPLTRDLGYLLIYRFDNTPQLNSSINQIDGWSLLCPSSEFYSYLLSLIHHSANLDLTNDDIYTYFLNNQQTSGHQSIIFGLRELNSTEMNNYCSNQSINTPPISDQPFNFTSNYELRTYTAYCYYLDENNVWQTSGLVVSYSIIFFS
jgi:hypothetical protein